MFFFAFSVLLAFNLLFFQHDCKLVGAPFMAPCVPRYAGREGRDESRPYKIRLLCKVTGATNGSGSPIKQRHIVRNGGIDYRVGDSACEGNRGSAKRVLHVSV